MPRKKANSKLIPINKDLESVIICAVRYALPRSTYMPSIVADFITSVWDQISSHAQKVIHNDILEFYGESFAQKEPWDRIITLKIDDKKEAPE